MPVKITMAADSASLTLHGDVGWEITPQAVASAIKGAAGKALNISLNSYGGDAFAGIAIHNMLARHDGKKTIVVEGVAASAGSLIAMAGDRIVMPENAFMMIHNAAGVSMGTADVQRETADLLDQISAAARRTYAQRTGLSEDEVGAMLDATTWMTAERAVELGFATEVSAPADIRMDAIRLSAYANLPAALQAAPRPAEPAISKEPLRMSAATPAPASLPADSAVTMAAPPVPPAPVLATIEELEGLAARGRLGPDFVLAQMKARATLAAATDAVIDAIAAKAPAMGGPVVQMVRDERETKAKLMANAMEHRAVAEMGVPIKGVALDDGARQFRGMSLVDMARECLTDQGVKTRGLTPMEIAELALSGARYTMAGEHSTSDFPNILANTASKSLRAAYEEAPRTFVPWTQRNDLPDFKSFKPMVLNAAPNLLPIAESGAVQYGTIGEGAETWNLVRYGRAIAVGYVAMVNDDMSAFTRLPAAFAQAAARLESDIVYQQLLANGNLADGGALFNSTAITTAGGHANLTTGASSAMTADTAGVTAVGALAERIGRQVAPGTNSPMNLRGRFVLVPTALETVGFQLFGNAYAANIPGVVNPYRTYEVISEARLQLGVTVGATTNAGSTTAYYVIANGIDTIHWGYLRGEAGPTLQNTVDFDTDGMKLKVNHNFGAKAVEFRGMAKSNGA
jgi:ATP-dependent protease ClpP protease subunit